MVKYLLKRIFALVLFAAMYFSPIIVVPLLALIAPIYNGIQLWRSGNYYSGSERRHYNGWDLVKCVIALVLILNAVAFMQDALNFIMEEYAFIASIVTIIGGYYAKRFVLQEKYGDEYYINNIVKVTGLYPSLLYISGGLRFIIELLHWFIEAPFPAISPYLVAAEIIGTVLFAIAIVMYFLRTIHIFINNK